MCGVPDFNALMLMGSRLIYFGGACISIAVIYKSFPIIKEFLNNFSITFHLKWKDSSIFAASNNPGYRKNL